MQRSLEDYACKEPVYLDLIFDLMSFCSDMESPQDDAGRWSQVTCLIARERVITFSRVSVPLLSKPSKQTAKPAFRLFL